MTIRLFGSASRIAFAPADEGTGGVPGGGSSPSPVVAPAAGAAADDGGVVAAVPAAADPASTILGAAKPGEEEAPMPAETDPAAETEEAKAARIAKEREGETPEAKAEREAKEKTDADAAKAEAVKPYEVLTLPEGMPKDQPAYKGFVEKAAELKIAPDQAQQLLDTVAPELQKAISAPYEAWAATVSEWVKACPNDAEFGGANYEKNMGLAASGINKLMGADADKFRQVIAFSGIGNNPEFIRFAYRVGKMAAEGSPVTGAGTGGKAALANRVYPDMN